MFAEHRLEVIRRRSEYELRKNEERLHILEALRIAIKNIDLVIQIIRKSKSAEEARQNLMSKLNLDEIQATAILDLQLRRLASLERQKIEDEYKQVSENIKNLKALLKSPQKMRQVEIEELKSLKAKYADPRRTQIIRLGEGEKGSELLTQTDVMPLENFWIEASSDGLLSRTDSDKPNRLGGDNAPWNMLRANSHQTVFLVTTEGKAAAIHSLAIPTQKNGEQGVLAHKLSPLSEDDILQGIFSVPMDREKLNEGYVLSVSRQGMVKRSALQDLPGASANSFVLAKINDGDELFQVFLTKGNQDLLLTTANGMSIRFNESEIRSMGLIAAGVNGIKLKPGDYVVGVNVIGSKDNIAFITRKGLAKRVSAEDYPLQGRYGQGVISWKLAKDDQIVVQAAGKLSDRVICHFRKSASKVFTLSSAVERTRMANGQSVFTLKPGDELIGATELDDFSTYWEKA